MAYLVNWKYPRTEWETNELTFEEGREAREKDGEKAEGDWVFYEKESEEYGEGFRLCLTFETDVKHVHFHSKGEYFLTVCPEEEKKN